MSEIYGVIYKITNTVNGKFYIGQTTNSITNRFKEHCRNNSGCKLIGRAIKKHGMENFKIEELCNAYSKLELNNLEILFIFASGSSKATIGYNLTIGGDGVVGHKHSEESRRKQSISQLNRFSKPESRIECSKSQTKRFSNHKNRETARKLNESQCIQITEISSGKTYESLHLACKELNLDRGHLNRHLRGIHKTIKGYMFKFTNPTSCTQTSLVQNQT